MMNVIHVSYLPFVEAREGGMGKWTGSMRGCFGFGEACEPSLA